MKYRRVRQVLVQCQGLAEEKGFNEYGLYILQASAEVCPSILYHGEVNPKQIGVILEFSMESRQGCGAAVGKNVLRFLFDEERRKGV